jgi:hypothetical protein
MKNDRNIKKKDFSRCIDESTDPRGVNPVLPFEQKRWRENKKENKR